MTDSAVDELVRDVHEHLEATKQLPVERTASRWIGEAEAVARDLVGAELSADVLEERLGHVAELLDEVAETGDAAADDHVQAARTKTNEALDRLDGAAGS